MSYMLSKEKLAEIYELWPLKEQLLGIPEEIEKAISDVREAVKELGSAEQNKKQIEAEIATTSEGYRNAKNEATRTAVVLAEAAKDPRWQAAIKEIETAQTKVDDFRKNQTRLERLATTFHDIVKLTVAEMNLAVMIVAAPEASAAFYHDALEALDKAEAE